jgi:hypothetical protein
MKTEPQFQERVPNGWENLDRAFRAALAVSKEALLKEEARLKAAKQKKREPKKVALDSDIISR